MDINSASSTDIFAIFDHASDLFCIINEILSSESEHWALDP